MEQLIVGVLLFVPLLALLPTTATWHLSLSLAQLAVAGLRWGLLLAAALLRHNPLALLACRALLPAAFPGAC